MRARLLPGSARIGKRSVGVGEEALERLVPVERGIVELIDADHGTGRRMPCDRLLCVRTEGRGRHEDEPREGGAAVRFARRGEEGVDLLLRDRAFFVVELALDRVELALVRLRDDVDSVAGNSPYSASQPRQNFSK